MLLTCWIVQERDLWPPDCGMIRKPAPRAAGYSTLEQLASLRVRD